MFSFNSAPCEGSLSSQCLPSVSVFSLHLPSKPLRPIDTTVGKAPLLGATPLSSREIDIGRGIWVHGASGSSFVVQPDLGFYPRTSASILLGAFKKLKPPFCHSVYCQRLIVFTTIQSRLRFSSWWTQSSSQTRWHGIRERCSCSGRPKLHFSHDVSCVVAGVCLILTST